MNRDERAAIADGIVTVLAGAAVLYAIGNYLSWLVVGVVTLVVVADAVWCAQRLWPWWAS